MPIIYNPKIYENRFKYKNYAKIYEKLKKT